MHPKLLLCHTPFGKDLAAVQEHLTEHDYDGVEWNLDAWRWMSVAAARKRLLETLRAASPACSLHAPYTDLELGHPDTDVARGATAILKGYLDAAADLGAHHVNLHTGSWAPAPEEWSRDNALRSLEALMTHAGERGVVLGLENLRDGPTSDPATLAGILRATGLGLMFDIGHANGSDWVRSGRGSAVDFLQAVPGPVVAAHVYWIEASGAHHVPRSVADIAPALDALRARGCDVWVLELHTRAALERTRAVVDEYLRAQRLARVT